MVSAGGVGFDVSCGVRAHLTGLSRDKIANVQPKLADALYREIPAGLGSHSAITFDDAEMTGMLSGGARWAIERGLGRSEDLERIEEHGCATGGDPAAVSDNARASGCANNSAQSTSGNNWGLPASGRPFNLE